MSYNGGSGGDANGSQRRSKGVLSTARLPAATVPILNAGDVGYGGPALLIVLLGSSRERAGHPAYCAGFLVLVLATFPFCVCFAVPYKLLLKVFHLKNSSFLRKGVCKNKYIISIIFLAFLSNKKKVPWYKLFFKVIDKSALPGVSAFSSCMFLTFLFRLVELWILNVGMLCLPILLWIMVVIVY